LRFCNSEDAASPTETLLVMDWIWEFQGMRSGNRTGFAHESFVLILHENLDFVRDVSKQLRSRGFACRSLCQLDFDKLSDVLGQAVMLVIDVDVIERHLRLMRRILQSRAIEERIFFVNAKRYEKGDWAKINTYCEMIALQDRLSRASRQQ
jgi:hypothetical protein